MTFRIRTPKRTRRSRATVIAVLAAALTAPLHGAPVRGIRALTPAPIAPRGGVLMLPLTAERPGRGWPATVPIELHDGTLIDGTVIWIHPRAAEPGRARLWTDDPAALAVRAVAPDDDTSRPTGGAPYLVARLPADGDGALRLGRQTLNPTWRDPDVSCTGLPLPGDDRPEMFLTAMPDRPDPDSSFEYWRWVLLADRIDLRPPAAGRYGAVGSLVAEHYADLWRIALAQLGRRHPGVAASARDALTRICDDGRQPFAAWVAGTSEPARLLGMLLDFNADENMLAREVLAWVESWPTLLVWTEVESGDSVRLAIVNRGSRPTVARFHWEDAPHDPPVAAELRPGWLTRVTITRPEAPPPSPVGLATRGLPEEHVLQLNSESLRLRIGVGAATIDLRPPGGIFPVLRPALTLADVQAGRQFPVNPATATLAHLRRRGAHWEMFFECRRPVDVPDGTGKLVPLEPDLDAVRTLEAVTLILGDQDEPDLVLTVPEHGTYQLRAGNDDGTLAVHRQSFDDRWHCRIVIPDSALPPPRSGYEDEPPRHLRVSALRSHGGRAGLETTPVATVPWRRTPAPAVLRLDTWDGW
ncbi:MAG: hypothetical protein GY715_04845 [Planctomycetes bacterium]|nr:hypothetical protein [Planctomycetota bacterium]